MIEASNTESWTMVLAIRSEAAQPSAGARRLIELLINLTRYSSSARKWPERTVLLRQQQRFEAGHQQLESIRATAIADITVWTLQHEFAIRRHVQGHGDTTGCIGDQQDAGPRMGYGLKAGVAGSARRSRYLNVFLIAAGSSMLAIILSAPPQCSQVIDLEHALQVLRPRHRDVAYGLVGGLSTTPAAPGRRHLFTQPMVRRANS